MPYYAVKIGKKPGIYENWNECKENINGFSGAKFHKFKTLEEAENYMNEKDYKINNFDNKSDDKEIKYPCAFVDGSFNPKTKVYGYGIAFKSNEISGINELNGFGDNEEMAIMRNIAGELLGAIEAVKEAKRLGLSKIFIYYDYLGIELWPNKEWNSRKSFVKDYVEFINNERANGTEINFIKVPAHTGVELNELADNLAKKACGII